MMKNFKCIVKNFAFCFLSAIVSLSSFFPCVYSQTNNCSLAVTEQPLDIQLGALFKEVQKSNFYSDQKTFADAIPKYDPLSILAEWNIQKTQHDFDLKKFIENNFVIPKEYKMYSKLPVRNSLREHINSLWPILTRNARRTNQYDSLLSLPKSYIVPGGRFREIYYWDSYFTMLGLAESNNWNHVQNMIDNFAYELNKYGCIPNGNRNYYLSRSQPPFFSLMVDLLATYKGDDIYRKYLPQLEKEYNYWMQGSDKVVAGQSYKRVIKLIDGTLLNRYWDDRDVPRTESWLDDVNTAKQAPLRNKRTIYRDLRAAAASGWDFSSRWFADEYNLASIQTTKLVPVDLNSLLFHLEKTIAKASILSKQKKKAAKFIQFSKNRQAAINHYLWNEKKGCYCDYNWKKQKIHNQLTAAALFPLYVKLTDYTKAKRTALIVEKKLLKSGGLVTTTVNSGQQWDSPNGWAPLQWIAVQGLEHYKQSKLADQIGKRFLQNVQKTYDQKHKLVEKYIVEGYDLGGGGGGEYPLQDGFGWTNGVTLMLLDKYCKKNQTCNNAYAISNTPVLNFVK
ncbi:alpha,alpha-trehalase TreA [Candidatus Pantoea carbekii]|uniref:alpha,alpha-trehalase TreA n=1 Tax=Candidatus Pantoea carbekii TaxID=1235990 RepID=UPI00061875E0|nr:alpha,alpha-trehalase TreA [Candidatus Pantoea carbekii]AKC32112.1 periplasmic trehalase precursor TreA [Candidatus Pantoea carbekii]